MSELGVFAVDRGIFDHPCLDDGEPYSRREAWLWMISQAAWKPRKKDVGGVIIELQRGQLAHSTRFMATAWRWSHSAVVRYIERLKKLKMVEAKTGTPVTVLSLCNYEAHQRLGKPTRNATGTAPEQTKSIQSIQEETPLPPRGSRSRKAGERYDDKADPLVVDFETKVWAKRWPRQGHNPRRAFAAYAKLSETQRSACKGAIERCARQIIAGASEARYRPMLATWINGRGWEADSDGSAPASQVDWRGRVAAFRASGTWAAVGWGPRPGEPGCQVPPDLLLEVAA